MAQGTILAEILLEGDRTFRRSVESSGDKMEDASEDATMLSGTLGFVGEMFDRTQSNAYGLARALNLVQSQADEAGDEINAAGRSALTTSGMFSTLTLSTNGLALSFGTLSSMTTLTLIPALIALSTTLVPLIGALGGFIAIAGSVAGLGIAGSIGAMATHGKELKATFSTLVATLKTELAPAFDLAAAVLQTLMWNFIDIIPQLLPAKRVMQELAGNFAQLGVEIIDMLPSLVSLAVTLAQQFLPPFVTFAQQVLPGVPGLISRLVATFQQVLPVLKQVGSAFIDILPTVNKFGMMVLKTIAPAVADAARGFGALLKQILAFTKTKQFGRIMTQIRAGVKELAPEISALQDNFSKLYATVAENGPALVRGFVAVADSVLDIINVLMPVVTKFIKLLGQAADMYAAFTKSSEKAEKQGLLFRNVPFSPFARMGKGGPPSVDPVTFGQTRQGRRTDRKIEVVVEPNDEKFDAYVKNSTREEVGNMTERGSRLSGGGL